MKIELRWKIAIVFLICTVLVFLIGLALFRLVPQGLLNGGRREGSSLEPRMVAKKLISKEPESYIASSQTPLEKEGSKIDSRRRSTFSFSYGNATGETVWVYSVQVLNNDAACGRAWANKPIDKGGISYGRKDCTPEALLENPAQFLWWKMKDPMDFATARRGPQDPSERFRDSVDFPQFDVDADAWRCFFTLTKQNKWVGKFEGVVLKPIGVEWPNPKKMTRPVNSCWIQFQFRNRTEREISFPIGRSTLANSNGETSLDIPNIPADGVFHGFVAHCHESSIYRPSPDARLKLEWGIPAYKLKSGVEKGVKSRTIDLPEFDASVTNWYCYFTLNPDNTWTASYEGLKQP